jgi:chromosome partitioning protein
MWTIGFVSEKGGVGKSTTVLNLSAGLGSRGKKILVIDADPQGNSTHVLLEGNSPARPTLREVLLDEARADEAVIRTVFENVDVIPADHALAEASVLLSGEVGRERRLRLAMESLEGKYDLVFVDGPPTRSLVTTNILNFVNELVVPVVPGLFALLGLRQLQADVAQVVRFLDNRTLKIGGVILSMVERNNVAKDAESQLREFLGPVVFETKIPRNVKVEEAHSRFLSVMTYAPGSPGAIAFDSLVTEFLNHVDETTKRRSESQGRTPRGDRGAA